MRAEFAKNLAQLRQKAGISQRAAAQALQVSQALLSHYEKGIREPGLDFVVRAADYYKVSADELLGRQEAQWRPELRRSEAIAAPSPFAREVEQEIWDTLAILLDMLNRDYDANVFCFASIYLSEALYELMRHLHRISEEYDPEIYHLSEESFHSGAVSSDMAWVRAQYIMALRQYKEQGGKLPEINAPVMHQRYGEALSSMLTLLRLAGDRVSRQDAAEGGISAAMFALPRPRPENMKSAPEEEYAK